MSRPRRSRRTRAVTRRPAGETEARRRGGCGARAGVLGTAGGDGPGPLRASAGRGRLGRSGISSGGRGRGRGAGTMTGQGRWQDAEGGRGGFLGAGRAQGRARRLATAPTRAPPSGPGDGDGERGGRARLGHSGAAGSVWRQRRHRARRSRAGKLRPTETVGGGGPSPGRRRGCTAPWARPHFPRSLRPRIIAE